MKKLLAPRFDSVSHDLTLFFVRLVTGYAFILHGENKILNPFGWMQGDAMPGFLQALGALAEFGGGILLGLGLLSRVASLGILVTMMFAIFFHAVQLGHPFFAKGGPSWEMAACYFLISLFLTIFGPGRYSVDAKIFGEKSA